MHQTDLFPDKDKISFHTNVTFHSEFTFNTKNMHLQIYIFSNMLSMCRLAAIVLCYYVCILNTITIYTIYYIRNIQNNGSLYVGCGGPVSNLLV